MSIKIDTTEKALGTIAEKKAIFRNMWVKYESDQIIEFKIN